jgi:integrase
MAKRNNHEGTIRKLKDGKGFKGAVRLGVDADGKPIRKWIQRKRKDEVQAELNRLRRKFELGQPVHSAKRTVAQFLTEWLEIHVRPNLEPNTYRGYEVYVRLHLIPTLGRMPLETLNAQDVQRVLNKAAKDGLSPTTAKGINGCLKTALTTAKKWRLVDRNVAKDATPPKQIKYESGFLNVEQAERLLKVIKGHRFAALIVISLMLGLRRGEVCALRWENIDLIDRLLYVREQSQRVAKKGIVSSTVKTKQSNRRIPIPQMVVDALIERQMIQEQEKSRAGAKWEQDGDFVFTSRRGHRIQIEEPGEILHTFLAEAGLPDIRFHDLRHSTASLLLSRGVHIKIVQEILGHASSQITMDLYSHLQPTALRETTNLMNDIFSKRDGESPAVVAQVVAPAKTATIQ